MRQGRKREILDGGFAVVVTPDHVAHKTDSGCWDDGDHLIGLESAEEARQRAYPLCAKCLDMRAA